MITMEKPATQNVVNEMFARSTDGQRNWWYLACSTWNLNLNTQLVCDHGNILILYLNFSTRYLVAVEIVANIQHIRSLIRN